MKKLSKIIKGHYTPALVVGVLVFILSIGCSTGIENTKKIELSKEDRKQTAVTAEDTFLNKIKAMPHTQWTKGKEFVATDNKIALIFESNSTMDDVNRLALGGKKLHFITTSSQMMPDGKNAIVLQFSDGDNILSFNTRKESNDTIFSTDIPMMIDLDIVYEVKKSIIGMTLWTRTSLWYDMNGENTKGKKFVPITVIDVTYGNKVFPIRIIFKDSNGSKYMMLMNVTDTGIDSRSFANLFFLSDPRQKYSHIEEDVWQLIQNGEVCNGMTKEECRLSLGSPKEVNKGHNYSSTLELWQYTDGIYLQFQDDILVNFRQ